MCERAESIIVKKNQKFGWPYTQFALGKHDIPYPVSVVVVGEYLLIRYMKALKLLDIFEHLNFRKMSSLKTHRLSDIYSCYTCRWTPGKTFDF